MHGGMHAAAFPQIAKQNKKGTITVTVRLHSVSSSYKSFSAGKVYADLLTARLIFS